MTDRKREPSVGQSLQVIFEAVSENTESIGRIATSQDSALARQDSAEKTSIKIYDAIKENSKLTKSVASMQGENLLNLSNILAERNEKVAELESKIKIQSGRITNFIIYGFFFVIILIALSYKLYFSAGELQEEKDYTEKVNDHFLKFIKESKLEKKYSNWKEGRAN